MLTPLTIADNDSSQSSNTKMVRSTNCISSGFYFIVTDPHKSNYVVRSSMTSSNVLTNMVVTGGSYSQSNNTGYIYLTNGGGTGSVVISGISVLWFAKGQTDVVAGAGNDLIARDTGLWHLSPEGDITPNVLETYPDFNWKTNSIGEITPR
jgi:hypothetical protein